MKSVLFGQKPTSRQLYLDARTKLILCLLTSFIMFSCNYTGVMRFVLPVLSALPFFSFLILKKYRTATGYILAYGICLFLPVVLRQYDAPFLNIMSAAIASIFTQMLPGLAMFNVLLSSTSVSEFIAAMDGFHISKKFGSGICDVPVFPYYTRGVSAYPGYFAAERNWNSGASF